MKTVKLLASLQAFGKADFNQVAKAEIQALEANSLPLQQGLSLSSYVSNNPFSVTILNSSETETSITIKAGVFYTGIIAGCSCSDDPTPQDEQNEYCEVVFTINKANAQSDITLLEEN